MRKYRFIAEQRVIHKGDIKQFWNDLKDYHVRTDDPIAAAGSVVMTPAVAVTKFGNALTGLLSEEQAVPLGDSPLKYTVRDVRSAAGNLFGAAKNIVTFHPIKAAGNVIKGGFDALDVVAVDPLLDLGSGAFGHNVKQVRSKISYALAA